jgi:hypothetical protein
MTLAARTRLAALIPIVVLMLVAVSATRDLAGRQTAPSQNPELPPLSWTCPMHPDVVEHAKGTCPICRMELAPIRLVTSWSCPVHSVVDEGGPGKCPVCRRDLAQVTVSLTWTCADRPDIDRLNPGKCPDGSATIPNHTARVHGNHNPQHGGLFFMAPDNWHHIEGTYPEAGLFRLHVYDDYSKPLPVDKVRQVKGRVVTQEIFDAATRTTRETTTFSVAPAGDGHYLEAKIDPLPTPAEMTAKLRFAADGPEYRFDFTFPAFSNDKAVVTTAAVDPSQLPVEIPDDTAQVLALLAERNKQIQEFIRRGAFADMYVPAFQAKDLALALDLRTKGMPAARRAAVVGAIERLVRSAWLLDAYGDLGNRDGVVDAYATFAQAVADVQTAFAPRPGR